MATKFKDGQIIGYDITDAENPKPIKVNFIRGEDFGFICCNARRWADTFNSDGYSRFESVEDWLDYAKNRKWFAPLEDKNPDGRLRKRRGSRVRSGPRDVAT